MATNKSNQLTSQYQIKDRIIGLEHISWKDMLSIRNDDLKVHTESQLEKLEQSLIKNGFIEPFAAWKNPETKEIYTINGHTRKKRLLALIEKGYSIPETLSAFFIDCKNLNDAASVLPLYESKYGNLDINKLDEFKITFDLDETKVVGSEFDSFFGVFEAPPNVDYSILNENTDNIQNEYINNVKKAIQIEFEHADYELAAQLIKYCRDNKIYIGKLLIEKIESIKK